MGAMGAVPTDVNPRGLPMRIAGWAILFVMAAGFAAAETAITTLWPWKIKKIVAEEGEGSSFSTLQDDISRVLTTLLIGVTICTVYSTALATLIISQVFGPKALNIATFALTLLTLIFAEILPKTVAVSQAEPLARLSMPLINTLTTLLKPVSVIVSGITSALTRLIGVQEESEGDGGVSQPELKLMLMGAMRSGSIANYEVSRARGARACDGRPALRAFPHPLAGRDVCAGRAGRADEGPWRAVTVSRARAGGEGRQLGRRLGDLSGLLRTLGSGAAPPGPRAAQPASTGADRARAALPCRAAGCAQVEMIEGVLDMENTQVKEVMKPRVDVVAIDANATVRELFDMIDTTKYSRIPVYEETIDNIIGVTRAQSLLTYARDAWVSAEGVRAGVTVSDLMEPTDFVPQTMPVMSALKVRAAPRPRHAAPAALGCARARPRRAGCASVRAAARPSGRVVAHSDPARPRRLLSLGAGNAQEADAHAHRRRRVRRHGRHRHPRGAPGAAVARAARRDRAYEPPRPRRRARA